MIHKKRLQQVETDARQLADSLKDVMHDAKEGVEGEAQEFLASARGRWEEGREFAKVKSKEIDRYAHEHVWQTAAVAAAVGAALAWLMRGKNRHE